MHASYSITCDADGCGQTWTETHRSVRLKASAAGWTYTAIGRKDYCPEHSR